MPVPFSGECKRFVRIVSMQDSNTTTPSRVLLLVRIGTDDGLEDDDADKEEVLVPFFVPPFLPSFFCSRVWPRAANAPRLR